MVIGRIGARGATVASVELAPAIVLSVGTHGCPPEEVPDWTIQPRRSQRTSPPNLTDVVHT